MDTVQIIAAVDANSRDGCDERASACGYALLTDEQTRELINPGARAFDGPPMPFPMGAVSDVAAGDSKSDAPGSLNFAAARIVVVDVQLVRPLDGRIGGSPRTTALA
ncbi:MAG: hypothetical protein ABSH03_23660 [Candidatus Lustribacter sp.]|jgi:hypothetical protein